jgi:transcription elongation factor GreA
MKNTKITQEGFKILENELNELKNIKKPKAVERLKKARGMGDLSENSEYAAAREEIELIENRILEVENAIKNAEIVSDNHNNHEVSLGSHVTVEIDGRTEDFTLVGEYEAEPLKNKLSITSPIGKALVGKRIGDTVEIEVPDGKKLYKVMKIS